MIHGAPEDKGGQLPAKVQGEGALRGVFFSKMMLLQVHRVKSKTGIVCLFLIAEQLGRR